VPGVVHVVDDDASFRTAIERRLKKSGYEVATYTSAQQLLDRLPNESELGCILLDVRIPGLSGPELQDRLSEFGSTLPMVFLTGGRWPRLLGLRLSGHLCRHLWSLWL
jgi:FixJ family two-component response regulator